jgi:RHS repeat-associated protein
MNINLALLLLDYSPGGMLMPDRYSSINVYRYGFQGQEKDDEVSGEGNSYDFGARMYNSRVSRFFGMDPVIQSHQSPYLYAANNPIYYVDLDGKDNIVYVVVLNSSHPDYVINAKEIKDDLNKMYEIWGLIPEL